MASRLAAAAPVYNPESDIKALRAAADAAIEAGNQLRSSPVERPRSGVLKDQVDGFVEQAQSAADAGQVLYTGTEPPFDEMMAALKGDRKSESVQKRQEGALAFLASLKTRWNEARDKAQTVTENLSQSDDGDDKRGKQNAVKDINDRLNDIDRLLKDAEEKLRDCEEPLRLVKENSGRARLPREELAKAADSLSTAAAMIRQAAGPAKDSIDALGAPPENESRGKVYQKIAAVLEGGKDIHYSADVAKNRGESFFGIYKKFFKASAVFNEDNKAACELFEDAKTQLGALERALAKLKDVR